MSKKNYPWLVVSDGTGNIFEIPGIRMAGMLLSQPVNLKYADFIPLPYGSDLFELPGRVPIGYHVKKKRFLEVREYQGNPVYAVAAFMAPAHVQCYRSAYRTIADDAPRLPFYSYTAVGWREDSFVVAGLRIDPDRRQDLHFIDLNAVNNQARRMLKRYPDNALVRHLIEKCVQCYGCPAARNFVLERWECPVPTSPTCNARCVGCISEQPEESGATPPQNRITFVPDVKDIVEFTVPHLEHAPRAVISFGQGCEGEPLLVGEVLEEAITAIRKQTSKGVINLNTNASRPETVERLFKAGLDSMRVSLNSAQSVLYSAYYQPRNYTFDDVVESLQIARRLNRWSSLNYFVFPGLTDHPQEIAALEALIRETGVNMIQARNLNMDPEWYMATVGVYSLEPEGQGIQAWIAHIQQQFPWIKFGYFNPPHEDMQPEHFPT
jgi:pyruvate-formate lyase-activating enzyme